MPKEIYEIFLSSTSRDLQAHREKVKELIERLRLTSIRMETFGAKETMPVKTCKTEVQKCDALVVIVGNRYGWAPSKKEGGDGIKSITWWEVTWALEAKIPVYAFLCNPEALDLESEQDRLLNATSEKMFIDIGNAVRNLKKFRAFLESKITRETFSNVGDLGEKVTFSLHNWILENAVQKERLAFQQEKVNPAQTKEKATTALPNPSSAAKGSNKTLHNYEQVYWQEQVHLTSAYCLPAHNPDAGIALIAGLVDLQHPALVHNTSIRQIDARSKKAKQNNKPDDFTTALAALLVGDSKDEVNYNGILPGAKLSIFQVLGDNYYTTESAILAALQAAIVEGNKVVCIPLGSTSYSIKDENVYNRAAKLGVMVVCPAGNEASNTPYYPAGYHSCISVAATDSNHALAGFSNFGDWITTAAPGVNIPAAMGNNSYKKMTGSSFSCGIVAGIVALLLKANKDLDAGQMKIILKTTGTTINSPTGTQLSFTQIDAFRAMRKASTYRKANTNETTVASKNVRPQKQTEQKKQKTTV